MIIVTIRSPLQSSIDASGATYPVHPSKVPQSINGKAEMGQLLLACNALLYGDNYLGSQPNGMIITWSLFLMTRFGSVEVLYLIIIAPVSVPVGLITKRRF